MRSFTSSMFEIKYYYKIRMSCMYVYVQLSIQISDQTIRTKWRAVLIRCRLISIIQFHVSNLDKFKVLHDDMIKYKIFNFINKNLIAM